MAENRCPAPVQVAVPIRIRGMSSQNRFFDEQTDTDWISAELVACRLHALIDLETEVHLTNLNTHVGGTFRVIWTNTKELKGLHAVGLALVDPEGDLWAKAFPAAGNAGDAAPPQVMLECQRCHQKLLSTVVEAQGEFLGEGFRVARHCEQCRATTAWCFVAPTQDAVAPCAETAPQVTEAAAVAGAAPGRKILEDLRGKGRVPLQVPIRVTREKYGTTLEDSCQTVNISRSGVLFKSTQNYEAGEAVQIVLNYKEGTLAIPLSAKVVRQESPDANFKRGVAVQLME